MGIKYEPLSDPPVIKICEWGPWAQLKPILVYKCLHMFYICFILRLRESFDSGFQEGFTIHFKKTRTLGIRLLTTSAGLYFRRSLGPPPEEKERGLISRTAACKSSRVGTSCMETYIVPLLPN